MENRNRVLIIAAILSVVAADGLFWAAISYLLGASFAWQVVIFVAVVFLCGNILFTFECDCHIKTTVPRPTHNAPKTIALPY